MAITRDNQLTETTAIPEQTYIKIQNNIRGLLYQLTSTNCEESFVNLKKEELRQKIEKETITGIISDLLKIYPKEEIKKIAYKIIDKYTPKKDRLEKKKSTENPKLTATVRSDLRNNVRKQLKKRLVKASDLKTFELIKTQFKKEVNEKEALRTYFAKYSEAYVKKEALTIIDTYIPDTLRLILLSDRSNQVESGSTQANIVSAQAPETLEKNSETEGMVENVFITPSFDVDIFNFSALEENKDETRTQPFTDANKQRVDPTKKQEIIQKISEIIDDLFYCFHTMLKDVQVTKQHIINQFEKKEFPPSIVKLISIYGEDFILQICKECMNRNPSDTASTSHNEQADTVGTPKNDFSASMLVYALNQDENDFQILTTQQSASPPETEILSSGKQPMTQDQTQASKKELTDKIRTQIRRETVKRLSRRTVNLDKNDVQSLDSTKNKMREEILNASILTKFFIDYDNEAVKAEALKAINNYSKHDNRPQYGLAKIPNNYQPTRRNVSVTDPISQNTLDHGQLNAEQYFETQLDLDFNDVIFDFPLIEDNETQLETTTASDKNEAETTILEMDMFDSIFTETLSKEIQTPSFTPSMFPENEFEQIETLSTSLPPTSPLQSYSFFNKRTNESSEDSHQLLKKPRLD